MHGPCHVSEDVVHGGQGGTLVLEGGLQQAENNILLNLYQYVHDCDGSNLQKYHLFAGHIVLSYSDQPLVHVFIP